MIRDESKALAADDATRSSPSSAPVRPGLAAGARRRGAAPASRPCCLDEKPGVGGQIYRGITATPVQRHGACSARTTGAASALAARRPRRAAPASSTGATVWSLDRAAQVEIGVSIGGPRAPDRGARA